MMNISIKVAILFIAFVFTIHPRSTKAQLAVIVHKSNAVENLTLDELKAIYNGKKLSWPDNKRILLATQKSENQISKIFFKKAIHKTIDSVKRTWLKMSLSGKAVPPKTFLNDDEVISYIKKNPVAIGFISLANANGEVKVIKLNGESPGSKAYPVQ